MEIETALKALVHQVYNQDLDVDLTRPDEQFGDLTTNVALRLAKDLGKKPREVAEELAAALTKQLPEGVEAVSIAGPGFINIRLNSSYIFQAAMQAASQKPQTYKDQQVVTEYSDPNPFKVLHIGHLYTSIVGDAISNLIACSGGQTHRVNFGGDVGLHVAKTMWAITKDLGGLHPEKLTDIREAERSEWMAKAYVNGEQAYSSDDDAKAEIIELNTAIYALHKENDHDSPLAQIYWTCRQWSYDYFDAFYARINTHFEKYYPESQTAEIGLATVKEQLAKGVYKESKGAVVFEGEPYGLHTRVFINSQGLPTYEAKDVGLIMAKFRDFHFDKSVIITGNDITEYMKVVLKSIEQFEPELAANTIHLTHGNVKLAGGVKMSSRLGNFLRATDVLEVTAAAAEDGKGGEDQTLGAVKYALLKSRMGADIIYIPEESVSLEGNSGPYLQYAHAQARSILTKADQSDDQSAVELEPLERTLARKISEYPEVIVRAVNELMPHHICTYLYELAQEFNRFYELNRVIDDARQALRLQLVNAYADVLADGLKLLNIPSPEKM